MFLFIWERLLLLFEFEERILNGYAMRFRIADAGIEIGGAVSMANEASAKHDVSEIRTLGFTRLEFGAHSNQFHIAKLARLRV